MHQPALDTDRLLGQLDQLSKLELVEATLRLGVYASKRLPRQYAFAVPPEGLRRAIRTHIANGGYHPAPVPQPVPVPVPVPAPYVLVEPDPAPAPVEAPAAAPVADPVNPSWVTERLKKLVDDAVAARMADLTAATRVTLDLPGDSPDERVEVDAGIQPRQAPLLARLIGDGMNVWVAGPAGSGKTFTVIQLATLLGYRVFRVPCSKQTPASLFMGFQAATGVYTPGIVWHAVEAQRNGDKSLIVWDEYDRLPAGIAVQANGLLDGSAVTFPHGETLSLADLGIRQVVCGNTFGAPTPEFPSAEKTDRSTLTRFVKVWWDYDEVFERALYPDVLDFVTFGQALRAAARRLGVTSLCISLRTFDGARKLLAGYGRDTTERLLIWEGLPVDDAQKLASALGVRIPEAA